MFGINVDILNKVLTASGILAGFAFATGIEILLKFKSSELQTEGSGIFDALWFFLPSSFLLISSSVSLSIISSYVDLYGSYYRFLFYSRTSMVFFALGLLLLFAGVIYSLFSWNKKTKTTDFWRIVFSFLITSIALLAIILIIVVYFSYPPAK